MISALNSERMVFTLVTEPSCDAGKYPSANVTSGKELTVVCSNGDGTSHIEPSHTSS